jgi:septum formation protein
MHPLISEENEAALPPLEHAKAMAVKKVERILLRLGGKIPQWILGADTLISLDGEALGKSATREEAAETLKKLSGRDHEVITACALFNGRTKEIDCRAASTTVSFDTLSPDLMEWYLDTGEWQGAAGSYKIQGLAGCFVTKITGSYSLVVGLPLRLLYLMLNENGYRYGIYE